MGTIINCINLLGWNIHKYIYTIIVYICNFVKTIFDIKYININLVMPLVGILSWI